MYPRTLTMIATKTVGILASYLAQTGKVVTQKVGEGIYNAVKARSNQKPAAQKILADLEQSPGDISCQTMLYIQLKKLLKEDQSFATYLASLLEENEIASVNSWIAEDHPNQCGHIAM